MGGFLELKMIYIEKEGLSPWCGNLDDTIQSHSRTFFLIRQ